MLYMLSFQACSALVKECGIRFKALYMSREPLRPLHKGLSGCAAGFNLRTKYKGHHNRNTQIRSTFSQDGTFLICGSDDGWVYIWTTGSGADDEKMPKQVGNLQAPGYSRSAVKVYRMFA